jgi:conjugative transfer region protein (TIGR03750 family)
MIDAQVRADGTVTFLPTRLNRDPIVVRGLTADELWICASVSGALGIVVGMPLAFLASTVALVPTTAVCAIALGVFGGGGALRRLRRGRPETWLYRHLQWQLVVHAPVLAAAAGAPRLVRRSGVWSTRRSRLP